MWPGGADHRRHRRVDDHVAGDVQVGDPVVGVDHGEPRAVGEALARWPPRRLRAGPRAASATAWRIAPRPSSGSPPAAASASPYSAKTSGKKARTAWPKMIGSDTRIIVALRCSENSTSSSLARAICCGQELAQRGRAHRAGVDDLAGQRPAPTPRSTVVVPSSPTSSIRSEPSAAHHGGLLGGAEVAGGHVRDVGLGVRGPRAHRVRVVAGVLLDRRRARGGPSCPRAAPG